MNKVVPAIDLLAHNAVAALVAIALLAVFSRLVVFAILRAAARIMQASVFEDVTKEDRDSFERRVKRSARLILLVLTVASLSGALVASYRGVRASDLGASALAWSREQDFTALRGRVWTALGLALGAFLLDTALRAIVAAAGKGLSRWKRLAGHQKLLPEAVSRLRTAIRAGILAATAVTVASTLELPAGLQRAISNIAYVLGAFFVSRAATRIGYLATDLSFGLTDKLTRLQGPLKALGDLKNLTAITKRVSDYLVYVGAATWVAGRIAEDAWYYNAGQIGLRLIIVFYASRVLVEVCILLVQEVFAGTDEQTEGELQRRKTLLPVIRGFLRYGIYFTGLTIGLKEANVDPTPLLAGAGVIGVAIGFGAQTFVGDIVAGFFILFEDLVLVGDLVEVGGVKGNIEEIGVRITKIRDDSGVLHCIPNGEVRKVANHSKAYVNAIVDVHVPYEEDLRRVRPLLLKMAEAVLEEEGVEAGPREVKVQELSEASILLRLIVRVPPGKDEDLGDVLRARAVDELCRAGIGAPRPRRAVLIDSALRVGSMAPRAQSEEEAAPPQPFSPPAASD